MVDHDIPRSTGIPVVHPQSETHPTLPIKAYMYSQLLSVINLKITFTKNKFQLNPINFYYYHHTTHQSNRTYHQTESEDIEWSHHPQPRHPHKPSEKRNHQTSDTPSSHFDITLSLPIRSHLLWPFNQPTQKMYHTIAEQPHTTTLKQMPTLNPPSTNIRHQQRPSSSRYSIITFLSFLNNGPNHIKHHQHTSLITLDVRREWHPSSKFPDLIQVHLYQKKCHHSISSFTPSFYDRDPIAIHICTQHLRMIYALFQPLSPPTRQELLGGGTLNKLQEAIDVDTEYIHPPTHNHITTWSPLPGSIIDIIHNENTNYNHYAHPPSVPPCHQHDLLNRISMQHISLIKSLCVLSSEQPVLRSAR